MGVFFLEYLRRSLRMGNKKPKRDFNTPIFQVWCFDTPHVPTSPRTSLEKKMPGASTSCCLEDRLSSCKVSTWTRGITVPPESYHNDHGQSYPSRSLQGKKRGPSWGRLRAKRNTRPITRSALGARKIEVSNIPYLQDPKDWSTWIPMKDSDHPQHNR